MEIPRQARRVCPATAVMGLLLAFLFTALLATPLEASAQGHRTMKGTAKKPRKKARHKHHKHHKRSAKKPASAKTKAPASDATASVAQAQPTTAPPSTVPTAPSKPRSVMTAPTAPSGTATSTTPPAPATSPSSTTPSAPTPTASAPSGLLMAGSTIRSFWLNQSAPGAITEAPDPAGSGETVFKFTVGDSDMTQGASPNPRAELITPQTITAGAEFWWTTKFFLPADFPAATPNFVTLLQGPFGPPAAGSPPFHIEANGGVLKWQRNATYDWDIPWQMPQVRNQWVSVMVHERFASDGWVELWINGQQVTFFAPGTTSYNPNRVAPTTRLEMATMDATNSDGGNSLYIQQYRKKGMYSSLTTYAGQLLVGLTRESVGG